MQNQNLICFDRFAHKYCIWFVNRLLLFAYLHNIFFTLNKDKLNSWGMGMTSTNGYNSSAEIISVNFRQPYFGFS